MTSSKIRLGAFLFLFGLIFSFQQGCMRVGGVEEVEIPNWVMNLGIEKTLAKGMNYSKVYGRGMMPKLKAKVTIQGASAFTRENDFESERDFEQEFFSKSMIPAIVIGGIEVAPEEEKTNEVSVSGTSFKGTSIQGLLGLDLRFRLELSPANASALAVSQFIPEVGPFDLRMILLAQPTYNSETSDVSLSHLKFIFPEIDRLGISAATIESLTDISESVITEYFSKNSLFRVSEIDFEKLKEESGWLKRRVLKSVQKNFKNYQLNWIQMTNRSVRIQIQKVK